MVQNQTTLAPIILFVYKRIDTLNHTINSLRTNNLASVSDLIIFSDGPKNQNDIPNVNLVREFLTQITGFKSITIIESLTNKGLANSIIEGVNSVFLNYDKVIVLEDDVVTSDNFLDFMNDALEFYKSNNAIFSISGWSIPIKSDLNYDVYFTQRSNSSCWATWKYQWEKIDWEVKSYATFRLNKTKRIQFNRMGSDMSSMLDRQMSGQINSWAIRWCYHQFLNDLYAIYPITSKAINIGYNSSEATHSNERFNRFKTTLDQKSNRNFLFDPIPKLNQKILKQFLRPHSMFQRIKYKLINSIFR